MVWIVVAAGMMMMVLLLLLYGRVAWMEGGGGTVLQIRKLCLVLSGLSLFKRASALHALHLLSASEKENKHIRQRVYGAVR